MSTEVDLPDHLQPPMANGEVVFEAPWESRIFGMAVALHEQGLYAWSDFQAALIHAVSQWELSNPGHLESGTAYPYYEVFQAALVNLLEEIGTLDVQQIDDRTAHLSELPHGHDHD